MFSFSQIFEMGKTHEKYVSLDEERKETFAIK